MSPLATLEPLVPRRACPSAASPATDPDRRPTVASRPRGRPPAALVLCPPWAAGGSANVFAAQVAAHLALGRSAALLVVPHDPSHDVDDPEWRRSVGEGFEAILDDSGAALAPVLLCGPSPDPLSLDPLAPDPVGRVSGRRESPSSDHRRPDDVVDVVATRHAHAAAATFPLELPAWLRSHRVEVLHVNHCYTMGLVPALLDLVRSSQRTPPSVVCETHDVQSHGILAQRVPNPLTGRADPLERLLASEVAALAPADGLVHITRSDHATFAALLPGHRHALLPVVLAPGNEAALRASRARLGPAPAGATVLYVGDRHMGNVAALRELLSSVMPLVLAARPDARLRVAGRIDDLFAALEPELHERWRDCFLGRVDSLAPHYAAASCVFAASRASTGSSVKLAEALCSGRPVATNPEGMRGLPEGATAGGLFVAAGEGSEALALAVLRALDPLDPGHRPTAGGSVADLYEVLFSGEAYRRRFPSILPPAPSTQPLARLRAWWRARSRSRPRPLPDARTRGLA